MSNVYDHAHALSKAIKESEQFTNVKSLQEQVNAEETSKRMFKDFREMQMQLQMKQMQGEELSEEEVEKANKLFETVKLNPSIGRLLDAEQQLSVMVEDVNKAIFAPLQEIYKEEE
jgi:cell fate (sporulation/competence/biofilm development) regulator YlbF (YheA/YmcA/DUF963 family)